MPFEPLDECISRYWRLARIAQRRKTIVTSLPDISKWYAADDRSVQEEANWILEGRYKKDAPWIVERLKRDNLRSVLELGCGSGLLAAQLRRLYTEVQYTGLDACEDFVKMAHRRAPELDFSRGDLRAIVETPPYDAVLCFQTLKHFGLHEWNDVLKHVLSLGRYAAFSMQTLPRVDMDNGEAFHHVYVTRVHLESAVAAAGHEVVDWFRAGAWELEGYGEAEDWYLWTRRDTST